MLVNIKRLFLVFILILNLDVFAQIKCVTKQYSTNDGLPDNRVLCSIKDREGFMWFGTWMGLCRFDGSNFKTYKSYPGDNSSLKNNRINALLEDRAGFLWLGADDGHVYRFDKQKEEFRALTELTSVPGLKDAGVKEIRTIDKRFFWLRTTSVLYLLEVFDNGAVKVTPFDCAVKSARSSEPRNIRFIGLVDSVTVIAGTDHGLAVIRKEKGKFVRSGIGNELDGLRLTSWSSNKEDICLGAANGEIALLNKATKSVKRFAVTKKGINAVCLSRFGRKLYCTTSGKEFFRINYTKGNFERTKISDDLYLLSIFEDSRGILWVEPDEKGVFRYDPVSDQGKLYFSKNLNDKTRERENRDFQVLEDSRGNIWINQKGAGFGYYYNGQKEIQTTYDDFETVRHFPDIPTILMYDPDGILWLTSTLGGVQKCVLSRSPFSQSFVPDPKLTKDENVIRGIMVDSHHRLWLGLRDGDLYVLQNGKVMPGLLEGEVPKRVYCIIEDKKGTVWLGTKGYGLFRAVPTNAERTHYKVQKYCVERENPLSIPSNIIYSLLEDSKGRIWAGSFERGLILIQEKGNDLLFKTVDNYFFNYPRANKLRVRDLAEDKSGNIWIGTTGGLLILEVKNGMRQNARFFMFQKQPDNIKSLGDNDVQFIYRDKRGTMWVLTSSGGLNQAIGAPTGKLEFVNYSTQNGLRNDCVLSCLEDSKGNLWLALQNGISRFSPGTRQIRNFDMNDGLSAVSISEASCAGRPDGSILFGTVRGYLSFHPEQIVANKIEGRIALTGLQVNNETFISGSGKNAKRNVNYLDTLILDHHQNNISIFYSVLNFLADDKTQYEFRLSGYDKSWQNNRSVRRTTYTNLDPGRYDFEVRAHAPDIYKNLPVKNITIIINPPYWKTWWAYSIYFILLAFIALLIKQVAATMLRLRHDVAVERKMTELKLNFFTQASHEIRTPLSLVINPLEEVLKRERLSAKGTEYVSLVLRNAQRMLRFFNQLLDLRKVQSGMAELHIEMVDLIAFLRKEVEYFADAARQRNISIKILSEFKEINVPFDPEKMDIVVYNILSNAIKFSPDGSLIQIIIEQASDGKNICIKIKDQGCGVQPHELTSIFSLYYEGSMTEKRALKGTGIGLALAKELIELHKGEITAENGSTGGLVVCIKLPSSGSDRKCLKQ